MDKTAVGEQPKTLKMAIIKVLKQPGETMMDCQKALLTLGEKDLAFFRDAFAEEYGWKWAS